TVAPTPTATATPTATNTATPTMTPSPSGTPTPICTPNIYLSTNPAGTLAFGDVKVGGLVTLPLMVTNNEPGGTLVLSTAMKNRNARSFSVTGGSCKTNNKLAARKSCTYQLVLKGLGKNAGTAV